MGGIRAGAHPLSLRTRRFSAGAAVLASGLVAMVAWLTLDPFGDDVSAVASAVAQSGAAALAGLGAWLTSRMLRGRHRRAWRLFALAGFAWAAGNVAWTWSDLTGAEDDLLVTAADVGLIVLLPLSVAALLSHPTAPRRASAVARLLVDAAIAGGAVLLVTRSLLTSARHEAAGGDMFENAFGVAYAVGDFAVVALAVLLAMSACRRHRRTLFVVAAAFVSHGVADGLFTYLVLGDDYATGSVIDVFWVAGFGLLALAARSEYLALTAATGTPSEDEPSPDRLATLLLPYGLVAIALVVGAVDLARDGQIETFLLWIAIGVAALVVARQVVDRYHNVALVRSLQTTVADLRDRDAKLAEAQRVAHLGSWVWDADDGSVNVTDEVFRVLGIPGAPLPLSASQLLAPVHPDERDEVEGAVLASVETGRPFAVDYRLAGEEGRIVHARGRPVTDEVGRTVGMVGTVQDVTTVRTLARELEQRLAELERSNADLTNFASLASHDLAAPVQLLAGHLQSLRRRLQERELRDELEMVDGALHGARRLEELIHDILAYSLATSGEDDLRTEVDVERIVGEAARTVGADDWAARVEIEPLPMVWAHPGQLRQLFQNLLSNAMKFVPSDRAPHIRVWAERDGGVWRFSVADNGIGVPAENRERMFRMFERGGGLDVGGTGIGLAICTRIVSRHGGHLWVEDAPGGGSVFHFTLGAPAAVKRALAEKPVTP